MAPSDDKRSARARRNTILRRSRGLAKKARELAVLSDSRLCLIVNFPGDMALPPLTWPEPRAEVEDVIRRYREISSNKKKGKSKVQEPAADNADALPGADGRLRPQTPPPAPLFRLATKYETALTIDELDVKLAKVRSAIESCSPASASLFGPVEAPTPLSFMPPASCFQGCAPVDAAAQLLAPNSWEDEHDDDD